jgi:outer membrane lipoprotein-sorting protein
VFSYQSPIQSNGQWVPSRLVVTNASGRQAGVSVFQNIRANGGIAASRFATN